MRTLTDEVVATATYNLPSQLDYVHLDWKDVKELSEALNLPAVVSLSLSHNALSSSLLPLRRCTNLWFLNLSHNKLACLDGLQAFSSKRTFSTFLMGRL
jgi:Leucine-rich repeat (LRR) protein